MSINNSKAHFDALCDANNHLHLDLSTLSEISGRHRVMLEHSIPTLSASIALQLEDFMSVEGNDEFCFPYGLAGVQLIEKYLLELVKPRISQIVQDEFGELEIAKIFTPAGLKSRNPDAIKRVDGSVRIAAPIVLGQCIAQAYGGKWVENGNGFLVSIGKTSINPFRKPLKFLKYGDGDSLVSYFKVCDPQYQVRQEAVHKYVNDYIDCLNLPSRPDKIQYWHDETGVERVQITVGSKVHALSFRTGERTIQ